MASIIPFNSDNAVALSTRAARFAHINDEVISSRGDFPTISIKGGKFTIVRDGNRQVLMKPDDPDEVAQSIQVVVLRANTHSRQFFANDYVEGESEGNKPTCYSDDGVAPVPGVESAQAKKCALCPHAVWGSGKGGKGSACKSQIRLAVATPDKLDDPYLLRVPPASFTDKEHKTGIKDYFGVIKARGLAYNLVVAKVGFDKESPSPKLTFKAIGVLPESFDDRLEEAYESDLIKQIVGLGAVPALPAPKKDDIAEELDAALEARKVSKKAAESAKEEAPAPKKKPVVEDAPEPEAPKKAKKPAMSDEDADLLGALDSLLGASDD